MTFSLSLQILFQMLFPIVGHFNRALLDHFCQAPTILSSTYANGVCLRRVQREDLLDVDVVLPAITEVVHIPEPFARLEAKIGQSNLIGIVGKTDGARVSDAILLSVDDKPMQMAIVPTHDDLHGLVQRPDRRISRDQDSPPHGRPVRSW